MKSNDKLEQLLRQMYAEEELHKGKSIETSSIIDEEWAKFEATHFAKSSFFTLHSSLKKIAAVFIGVLMLSGFAYAAFHYFSGNAQRSTLNPQHSTLNAQRSTLNTQHSTLNTQPTAPIIFKDAELETILHEVAAFYECETVYENEKARHLRLYFTWDKTKTIDEVVGTFNKFERLHITREDKKLIVN